jgi:hypothetical protein
LSDIDLDEIFSHIKQLKKEDISNTRDVRPIDKKKENKTSKDEDNSKMNLKNDIKPDIKNNKLNSESKEQISKMINKDKYNDKKQNLNYKMIKNIDVGKDSLSMLKNYNTKDNINKSNILSQTFSKWNEDSHATCDLCKKDIILGKNLSGLVVDEKFFACESCCINSTNTELFNWTKQKMQSPSGVRPIGVWITQKNSKYKSILFRK